MTHNYEYPRPAYTADTVVFNTDKVLLIKRRDEPFKGKLALPGGYVNEGESGWRAARRELTEEAGLILAETQLPKLVGIYDSPGRDPRGWVISAAFRVRTSQLRVKAGDDATEALWVPLNKLDRSMLAFDHYQIICDAWSQEEKEI